MAGVFRVAQHPGASGNFYARCIFCLSLAQNIIFRINGELISFHRVSTKAEEMLKSSQPPAVPSLPMKQVMVMPPISTVSPGAWRKLSGTAFAYYNLWTTAIRGRDQILREGGPDFCSREEGSKK